MPRVSTKREAARLMVRLDELQQQVRWFPRRQIALPKIARELERVTRRIEELAARKGCTAVLYIGAAEEAAARKRAGL